MKVAGEPTKAKDKSGARISCLTVIGSFWRLLFTQKQKYQARLSDQGGHEYLKKHRFSTQNKCNLNKLKINQSIYMSNSRRHSDEFHHARGGTVTNFEMRALPT